MTTVGTTVGRYELLRLLAAGGMGEVYLARQRSSVEGFTSLVAIKVLLKHLSTNQAFVRMFLDEARIVGRLHHKNIVQVRDVAEHEGQYFMVMEYIAGQNLRELLGDATIRDRPLFEPRLGAEVFSGIADALAAAHAAGLVHRDISPNNIMIGDDGVAKLIDFGVARAMGAASLTTPGTLKGKFGYMAPEYVRSQAYDHRVDVFSLGVVMWETFARRRLFRGPNEAAQMHQLLEAPIPLLSDELPGFPVELAQIVAHAVERDPARRLESASVFARQLGELARALPSAQDLSLRQWLERRLPGRLEDRRQTDEMLKALPSGAPIPDFAPDYVVDLDPGATPMTYNYRASGFLTTPPSNSQGSAPGPGGQISGTSIRLANGETTAPPPPAAPAPSRRGLWIGAALGVAAIVAALVLTRRDSTPVAATTAPTPAPAQDAMAVDPAMSLAEAHRQIGLKAMADGDYAKARSEYAEALRAGGSGDLVQLMEMANQLESEAARKAEQLAAATTAAPATPPATPTDDAEPAAAAAKPGRPAKLPKINAPKPARPPLPAPTPTAAAVTTSPAPTVEVTRPAATAPAPQRGDLVVTALVPKAVVRVDGKVMGQTPLRVQVDPGEHRIEISAGTQPLETRAIAVTAGETTVIHVDKPLPAPAPVPAPAPAPAPKPTPLPTPRVTTTGDPAVGARTVGACNRCHAESGASAVSARRYTRAQWNRFFATGQHDRYVPIGDRMSATQLAAVKAHLNAHAADAPENQGAGIRE